MNAEDPFKKALNQRKRQNTGVAQFSTGPDKSVRKKEVQKTQKNVEIAQSDGSLDLKDLDYETDKKKNKNDTEIFNAAMAAIKAL